MRRQSCSNSCAAVLLAALTTAACGGDIVKGVGAPFSETWQSDQGKSIAALEEHRARPTARAP